jgi:phage shock protein PspC (stress-responsive transcriptional regulator)
MGLDNIVALILALLVTAYLIAALVFPERF